MIGKIVNDIIIKKTKRFDPYKNYCGYQKRKEMNTGKENILITIINGAYGHVFEGLYARKAALQGKNVHILRCGGYLSNCETINNELSHKRIRCEMCKYQQMEFMRAFGGVECLYADYIAKEDKIIIDKYIDSFFKEESEERNGVHRFGKVVIDPILYSALQRYYLISQPEIKNDHITRSFLKSIISTLIVMEKICNQIRPKYVLSSHGTYSTWGAVVEYCKANNIYVITFGQNYNHGGIEFTYDDSYLTGVLNDTENSWVSKQLSEKERATVIRFLEERLGYIKDDKVAFDYNKNNKTRYSRQEICQKLGIDPQKKIVGMFPNIPWDGQVTGGSTVFPQFMDWLKYTVDYLSTRDDVVLVIRSHPAEILTGDAAGHETTATMLKQLYGTTLPENVILLEPRSEINSYTLGENSDFGVAFSSTVSLELTYLGIPVIICGCPPFKDKDVAFDIASTNEYREMLTLGLEGKLIVDQERKERLLKYLHYFFFMRTMPQTLLEVQDTAPKRYLFNSEEELNKDVVFHELYNCIETKSAMDFSKFYD